MKGGPNQYQNHDATLKLKQKKRNDLMDDSFKLNYENFREYLPEGIGKLRIIPGKETSQLQIMTGLVYGEGDYMKARVEKWFRDWKWTRNWITDDEGARTDDLAMVHPDFLPYLLFNEEGLLYYWTDNRGRPSLPPEHLQWDISAIRHFITTRLGIMSAIKNEELIASTLEDRDIEPVGSTDPEPIAPEEVRSR